MLKCSSFNSKENVLAPPCPGCTSLGWDRSLRLLPAFSSQPFTSLPSTALSSQGKAAKGLGKFCKTLKPGCKPEGKGSEWLILSGRRQNPTFLQQAVPGWVGMQTGFYQGLGGTRDAWAGRPGCSALASWYPQTVSAEPPARNSSESCVTWSRVIQSGNRFITVHSILHK